MVGITLTERDFRALVSGETVRISSRSPRQPDVEITFAPELGLAEMTAVIESVLVEQTVKHLKERHSQS